MALADLEHGPTMLVATLKQRSLKDGYKLATEKKNFDGQYTASSVILTLSVALALYNSLELVLLISTTFKRWKGLYFWSLCICNLGVVLYSLGMMIMYFNLTILWFSKVVLDIGWVCMVPFQSLVLYSRLNLVLDNPRVLSAVKWMIIINGVLLCIPTVTLDFGTTYSTRPTFAQGYFYIEHIQMTGFTIQEMIISGIYVWKTIDLLKVVSKTNTRTMVWQLLVLNLIILGMDIALVVMQFKHLQLYQESIKAFVYSVKLKLELNILSRLVDLVRGNSSDRSTTLEVIDSNTLPGKAQVDLKRELSEKERLDSWSANDNKGAVVQVQDKHSTGPGSSSSVSQSPEDKDEITRVLSQRSQYSARTTGRDSDILYADFLRSMN